MFWLCLREEDLLLPPVSSWVCSSTIVATMTTWFSIWAVIAVLVDFGCPNSVLPLIVRTSVLAELLSDNYRPSFLRKMVWELYLQTFFQTSHAPIILCLEYWNAKTIEDTFHVVNILHQKYLSALFSASFPAWMMMGPCVDIDDDILADLAVWWLPPGRYWRESGRICCCQCMCWCHIWFCIWFGPPWKCRDLGGLGS